MNGDMNGVVASLSERMKEVSALWGSLGIAFHPHLPTNLPDHLMCERLLGSVKGGQGLSGRSVHVGKLITPHPTAQGLGPALPFQYPRLPHQSAPWAEPLPLSWKPQVKSVRSLTSHSLYPLNTQTLLGFPGQVRLRS